MRESPEFKKKKNAAFQTSHKMQEEDEEDFDFEIKSQDNEMVIIAKKILNMYKKRNGFRNRQLPRKEPVRGETNNQLLTYFECKKFGHKKTKCLFFKKKS